jgi:lipoprotein-anchoring transpeptidase ErfK/SrfK
MGLGRRMLPWLLAMTAGPWLAAAQTIDGITFAAEPGKLYLPLDEAGHELSWAIRVDEDAFHLNHVSLDPRKLRTLVDGTLLVPLDELERAGAVLVAGEQGRVEVIDARHRFTAATGPKRAEVSLAQQQLNAWQGGRVVLRTHISSGRRGSTPAGNFVAGPYKARMHYSTRYHNAPMPWSVQIHGHVFIHGFASVPDYPASHGCIRVPLDRGNPAKFFYEWIDPGTPVKVTRE